MSGEGIQFPVSSSGAAAAVERSSSVAGKATFAAAFKAVGATAEAAACEGEKNWRWGYTKHIAAHVRAALDSKRAAVDMARAGLEHLHSEFEFVRDGKACSLKDAMAQHTDASMFSLGEVVGTRRAAAAASEFQCRVPYKGGSLEGEALLAQLKEWETYGTIEPSAASAIREVVSAGSKWCDLRNHYFVLLGALSAMGPYEQLIELGANIIALDLDRPGIWERLITRARSSAGRLLFPMKRPQSECKSDEELFANAGCNLITHAPEVAHWLVGVEPKADLTVGCYVYLDGEAHVRVALACDMVIAELAKRRKASVAYLCTPTDMHVIPHEAHRAAEANYALSNVANVPLIPIRALGGRKVLAKNVVAPITASNGDKFFVVDGLVAAQGPNYALAKRLQHWRAIVSREIDGVKVSSNVAPSTATRSVTSNRQFAWAYDGMPYFKPYEIFQQETSNAVMTALLLHDISDDASVANPATELPNPYALFQWGSFHGGVWRSAYKVGSIGEVSVAIHFAKVAKPFIFLLIVLYTAFRLFM